MLHKALIMLLAVSFPIAPLQPVRGETREPLHVSFGTTEETVFAAAAVPGMERLSIATETPEAKKTEDTPEGTQRLSYILAALFGFGLGVMALGRIKKAAPPGREKGPGA